MKFEARPQLLGVLTLIAALILGLPTAMQAAEAAATENAEAAATETATARTHATNGVTITWNLDEKRYESPSAENAARLAEEFRELLTQKLVGTHKALAPAETVDEVILSNGTVMRRLNAELLSTSVVRVDQAGQLVGGACVDGHDAAASLSTPLPAGVEEER